MPSLDLTCVQTHTHISGRFSYSAFITYTHPYPCLRLIACINSYHIYMSVSLARIRRYTQLAYLFHQCATSLLSRDGRIADCTVRHPGVERPFSCSTLLLVFCWQYFNTATRVPLAIFHHGYPCFASNFNTAARVLLAIF